MVATAEKEWEKERAEEYFYSEISMCSTIGYRPFFTQVHNCNCYHKPIVQYSSKYDCKSEIKRYIYFSLLITVKHIDVNSSDVWIVDFQLKYTGI